MGRDVAEPPTREGGHLKVGIILTREGVERVTPMAGNPTEARAALKLWESLVDEIESFNKAIRRKTGVATDEDEQVDRLLAAAMPVKGSDVN